MARAFSKNRLYQKRASYAGTQRFTVAELSPGINELRTRIAELESENAE
ncbi:MAG: hypothetical protein ABJN98_12720 [Roseibium sp.]